MAITDLVAATATDTGVRLEFAATEGGINLNLPVGVAAKLMFFLHPAFLAAHDRQKKARTHAGPMMLMYPHEPKTVTVMTDALRQRPVLVFDQGQRSEFSVILPPGLSIGGAQPSPQAPKPDRHH
jgi:hypothetical protein